MTLFNIAIIVVADHPASLPQDSAGAIEDSGKNMTRRPSDAAGGPPGAGNIFDTAP